MQRRARSGDVAGGKPPGTSSSWPVLIPPDISQATSPSRTWRQYSRHACHEYCHIKWIGFLYIYYLITPKVSPPSILLVDFVFGDISLSMMTIITTPFGYDKYETQYSYFVEFHI